MKKEKIEKLSKIFPDYFKLFILPEGAHEEAIKVYRAFELIFDFEAYLADYRKEREQKDAT